MIVAGAAQTDSTCHLSDGTCADEMHSLLQTAARAETEEYRAGSSSRAGEVGQAAESFHSLADTAEEVQAARASTNAAMGFESQAAELLKLGYKEVKEAEDIQEARAYQEANVTQILHEAVQRLQQSQEAFEGPETITLLQGLRRAEIAQAAMIKSASQEDQALAGLRSAMASAAQAATSAKLVEETQTSLTLDNAMAKILDSAQFAKEIPMKLEAKLDVEKHAKQLEAKLEETHSQQLDVETHAKQLEAQLAHEKSVNREALIEAQKAREGKIEGIQKELANVEAERHKAEVARQEASAMYQAAASTQSALEAQASRTAQSLLKVSAEASRAARVLEGALGDSSARVH